MITGNAFFDTSRGSGKSSANMGRMISMQGLKVLFFAKHYFTLEIFSNILFVNIFNYEEESNGER